jgi:hypothetical protein
MAKISFNAQMGIRFRKITSDYGKINLYVHETAMLILRHAAEHKDCSTAQGLVNAMPQSARKLALINWFGQFSPIVVKDDDKWESKMHKEGSKLFKAFDLEGAEANPWFTIADKMGAEKPPVGLDGMVAWLEAQAKSWEKKADEGKVDAAELATAKALAAQLRAIKLVHIAPANDEVKADEGFGPMPLTAVV